MSFYQERRVNPRTVEIRQIFEDNREEITHDLESLELSFRDLAIKWAVHDRSVRQWAERVGIDPAWRTKERRVRKLDHSKCKTQKSKSIEAQEKPQAHLLRGLW